MIIRVQDFPSRGEQIAATVLEILGAIAPRELREDRLFSLVRFGPVKDVTRAEVKAELNTCCEVGWAEPEFRSGKLFWWGTRAAQKAAADFQLGDT